MEIYAFDPEKRSYILMALINETIMCKRNSNMLTAKKLHLTTQMVASDSTLDEEQLVLIESALTNTANRRDLIGARNDANKMREIALMVKRIKSEREGKWMAKYFERSQEGIA